jgi:hypothetical protein
VNAVVLNEDVVESVLTLPSAISYPGPFSKFMSCDQSHEVADMPAIPSCTLLATYPNTPLSQVASLNYKNGVHAL